MRTMVVMMVVFMKVESGVPGAVFTKLTRARPLTFPTGFPLMPKRGTTNHRKGGQRRVTTSRLDIRPVTFTSYTLCMQHALASQLAEEAEEEEAELNEALALGAEEDEAA